MGKLKVGAGSPDRAIVEDVKVVPVPDHQIDMMALVQQVVDILPKPEAVKEIDLSPLTKRLEQIEKTVMADMMSVDQQLEDLKLKVEVLAAVEPQKEIQQVVVPEVKQITHIKDVSADVKKELELLVEKVKIEAHLNLNDARVALEKELKKQKVVGWVLAGLLMLSTLIHSLV